jgi:hypothetical protein
MRKIDALNHVCNSGAAANQCRALVNHSVPDLARVVIARVVWAQQFPSQTGFEILDGSWRIMGDLLPDVIVDSARDLTDRPLSDQP